MRAVRRRQNGRNQPLPQAEIEELDVGRRAQLRLDGVVIVRRGLAADVQRRGDLIRRPGIEDHAENLKLTRRQILQARLFFSHLVDGKKLADLRHMATRPLATSRTALTSSSGGLLLVT